jgi:hypothetical protein
VTVDGHSTWSFLDSIARKQTCCMGQMNLMGGVWNTSVWVHTVKKKNILNIDCNCYLLCLNISKICSPLYTCLAARTFDSLNNFYPFSVLFNRTPSYYFVFGMHEIILKIINAYFNVSPIIECFLCVLLQVPVARKLFMSF